MKEMKVLSFKPMKSKPGDHSAPGMPGELLQGNVLAGDNREAGDAGEAGFFSLALENGSLLRARRAAGCLLLPEPGDLVLAFVAGNGSGYILNVLEKSTPDSSTLSLPGKVEIEAQQGLALNSPDISLRGVSGSAHFVDFGLSAFRVETRAHKATILLDSMRSTVRLVVQNIRDSLRRVSNLDTVEAKRMRTRVDESYHLKAGKAKVLADEDVSIDGERIHLG